MSAASGKRGARAAAAAAVLLLVLGSVFTTLRQRRNEPLEKSGFLLDTVISVTVYGQRNADALESAYRLCEGYEELFSPTKETSDVWRMNHRAPGENRYRPSEDVLQVLRTGLEFSRLTDGAFDITVEPVSTLWDFKSGTPEIPDEALLKEAVSRVDWRKVSIEGDTVVFADDSVQVDPGSVAKGYIADRIAEHLKAEGVTSAIINLGGNVLCVGEKPGGQPFAIAVRKPEEQSAEVVKVLDIRDASVVTSGVYERHFVTGGVNYHHILDPKTGMPVRNGLLSLTIVGPSSLVCDALSTSCFALGEEKGAALLDSMEDYCGYFIREDGTIRATEGAQ